MYDLPVSDVIVAESARNGCQLCPPDRKAVCPLELGYERQRDLDECRTFLARYYRAVLLEVGVNDSDDEQHRRDLWDLGRTIERELATQANGVFACRFPISCPYCSANVCTLRKGYCQNQSRYRTLHEAFLIDIPATLKTCLGISHSTGMYALFLLK